MSKLIVITGITGVQGSSIADVYLNTPGWKVRGVTRNLSSEKAKAWRSEGVEMVQGDVNDVGSLEAAFDAATVIFGVTDFWTIFQDPESQKKKKPGQDITEYCFQVELQQGKNLADAAAKIPTLHRYIYSSMANATKWSNGKFQTLYHMDSKALAVDYARSLPGLTGKLSQVQAPIYFNLLWQWGLPTTPRKQPDGSYDIAGPGQGDQKIPFGDVRGDFGRCIQAVADAEPDINLFAVGQYITWNEYLDIWCQSRGVKKGKFNEYSLEKMMEVMPGGLGREFGENVLFATEFGYEGGEPGILRPGDLGVRMTSFKDYCDRTDFSSIL